MGGGHPRGAGYPGKEVIPGEQVNTREEVIPGEHLVPRERGAGYPWELGYLWEAGYPSGARSRLSLGSEEQVIPGEQVISRLLISYVYESETSQHNLVPLTLRGAEFYPLYFGSKFDLLEVFLTA